jgi:hypothetical protein
MAVLWATVTTGQGAGRARGATATGKTTWGDLPASRGYWMAAADGGVFDYGGGFHGSMGGRRLNRPVVAMASTPSGRGYWLAASDGGIFAFGDAGYFGSTGALSLNQPIVGMASTPSGRGYWLVAADGGLFAFGDAGYYGSTGGQPLPAPVVGMAVTPGGVGYWLVGAKGDVYAFGDARLLGSAGGVRLARPVVGMAAAPGGKGYWLAASDGGVFAFGDAPFLGSTGGMALNRPIIGVAAAPRGVGYWLVASDGGTFTYGDARFAGSPAATPLAAPVVGLAPLPVRIGPEVSAFYYPWWANPSDGAGVWRHWEQGGHNPPNDVSSDFYPKRGAYSSADAAVLDQHMADMQRAGIDTVVSSWWGPGSYEDSVLPKVVAAARAHGLRVAVHIEPYGGRTPASVQRDINGLRANFAIDDYYVYEAMLSPASDWAVRLHAVGGVRVLAETGSLSAVLAGRFAQFARDGGFDGVYTYDPVRYHRSEFGYACGAARQRRLLCGPSVAPGQVATRTLPGRAVVDRQRGLRYDLQWLEATDAGADLVSITSYNEWHEGTQIEPARHWCWPQGGCSPGYSGDFGRTGLSAQDVYLDATFAYARRFRDTRS